MREQTSSPSRAQSKRHRSDQAQAEGRSVRLERKSLLQDYAHLRERVQRTSTALAAAAHDLKTPLAIMNGYVELLQGEKLGDLNVRQKEILAEIASNGQRLQQYIEDFLTFGVLESGELKMNYEAGDLNEVLREVCRIWSHRFQQKAIALYYLNNPKLPCIAFDGPKLQRVLSNLLENAAKYTPGGGTVWLHAELHQWDRRAQIAASHSPERRRRALREPNCVKISLSDTGPGIAPEYHLEIFDDFFRIPGGDKESGMGLGLAIARRLVMAMGGKLWVESELDAGCKFSFLVPLNPLMNVAAEGRGR